MNYLVPLIALGEQCLAWRIGMVESATKELQAAWVFRKVILGDS